MVAAFRVALGERDQALLESGESVFRLAAALPAIESVEGNGQAKARREGQRDKQRLRARW